MDQRAHEIEPFDRVLKQVPERDDQQIAQRVAGERSLASEPMLHDAGPRESPRAVFTERREGHPQITRRQDIEFGTESAR